MSEREKLFRKPLPEIVRMMAIVRIVQERQRQVDPGRGVLPITVQAFLRAKEYRAEQTIRHDMCTLWQAGYLERIGGEGSRRGYRALPYVPVPPTPFVVDLRGLKG